MAWAFRVQASCMRVVPCIRGGGGGQGRWCKQQRTGTHTSAPPFISHPQPLCADWHSVHTKKAHSPQTTQSSMDTHAYAAVPPQAATTHSANCKDRFESRSPVLIAATSAREQQQYPTGAWPTHSRVRGAHARASAGRATAPLDASSVQKERRPYPKQSPPRARGEGTHPFTTSAHFVPPTPATTDALPSIPRRTPTPTHTTLTGARFSVRSFLPTTAFSP